MKRFSIYIIYYVIILIENSAGIISVQCLMEFLETSDCTDESRKDETYLQFKMKKHYIKTWKNLS